MHASMHAGQTQQPLGSSLWCTSLHPARCTNTRQQVSLCGLRTGQEYVWQKVWASFDVGAAELGRHFSGPSFLAWNRMGNLRGYGGPLPQSYIDDQAGSCAHVLSLTDAACHVFACLLLFLSRPQECDVRLAPVPENAAACGGQECSSMQFPHACLAARQIICQFWPQGCSGGSWHACARSA
jgi:hypothetical protein